MRNFLRQGRRDGSARAVFVPGEDVLLLSVALPPMPAAQRRAAVAFAVEDRIARPLDEVHVILGPALDNAGHWLVAVVGRACMAAHLARLRPGPGVRVLPDTLTVPVPPAGHWAAREEAGRVLLRMADGTGMAVRAETLGMLHRLAGQPVVLHHGGVLPEGIALVPAPGGPIRMTSRRDDMGRSRCPPVPTCGPPSPPRVTQGCHGCRAVWRRWWRLPGPCTWRFWGPRRWCCRNG